jgi:hypothetical protein
MTDRERTEEAIEEAIEDLDAPAEGQYHVVGGAGCGSPSMVCWPPTCGATEAQCTKLSHKIIVYDKPPG